jgi:hypothetical protein
MLHRPIYGISSALGNGCHCVPDPPLSNALLKLRSVLEKLRTVIDQFYNPFFGVAQVVGVMTMSAKVSLPVFIRLKWIEEHPNTKFDKTNATHLDDIRFLYNIANKDWHTDPIFNVLGTTAP